MPFRSAHAEYAWAVGVFEGEGTITKSRRTRRLAVVSTDEDVILRVHAAFGVGTVRGPYKEREAHYKPRWMWDCNYWPDLQPLLQGMLPYLSERRRARAEEMLADPPSEHYSHHRIGREQMVLDAV